MPTDDDDEQPAGFNPGDDNDRDLDEDWRELWEQIDDAREEKACVREYAWLDSDEFQQVFALEEPARVDQDGLAIHNATAKPVDPIAFMDLTDEDDEAD